MVIFPERSRSIRCVQGDDGAGEGNTRECPWKFQISASSKVDFRLWVAFWIKEDSCRALGRGSNGPLGRQNADCEGAMRTKLKRLGNNFEINRREGIVDLSALKFYTKWLKMNVMRLSVASQDIYVHRLWIAPTSHRQYEHCHHRIQYGSMTSSQEQTSI